MTTEPEYPIISTADLVPGQEFRYGPNRSWQRAVVGDNGPHLASWVEAKPAPIQVGDRVRYEDGETTATVKGAGTQWLIVQVDDDDGDYEDTWLVRQVERIDPDAEADR